MLTTRYEWTLLLALSASALTTPARAQGDQTTELAKKLSNPVANLISVPVQYNDDDYGGTNDGASASRLVFQPVVPFSLNEDWNLITRTLIPVLDQRDFPLDALNEIGARRHYRQPVLFAEIADRRRLDLGAGADRTAADGRRRCARHGKVRPRADVRGAEAIRAVDRRLSGRSHLVRGR